MKAFRTTLVAATMLLLLASAVLAQKSKSQKSDCAVAEAPEFRGFRLGMTGLEVRMKLEDTTLYDQNMPSGQPGSHAVRISAAELKEELAEGIDEVNLAFVDGKLAMIKVTYNGASAWDGAEDFLTKETARMGLPAPAPSATRSDNEKYRVECKKFAVTLAYSFGVSPSFTINDMEAQRVADERKKDDGNIRRVVIGIPGQTGRP